MDYTSFVYIIDNCGNVESRKDLYYIEIKDPNGRTVNLPNRLDETQFKLNGDGKGAGWV